MSKIIPFRWALVIFLGMVFFPQSASAGYWSQMISPANATLNSVWGRSQSDVYAAGENGTILHFDGAGWSLEPGISNNTFTLYGVWMDQANVMAVGDNGTALRYTNGTWNQTNSLYDANFTSVWGVPEPGPFQVFATGYTNNGSSVYAYDGGSWYANQTLNASTWLQGIWGFSASEVRVVTNATNPVASPPVMRYDGTSWSNDTVPLSLDVMLRGIWGYTSPQGYYAVGDYWDNGTSSAYGLLLNTNSTTWSQSAIPQTNALNSVWASSAYDAWAVGDNGTVLHYNGTYGSVTYLTNSSFHDVWGCNSTSAYYVFAVGENGTIWRYIGGAPTISSYTASPSSGTTPLSVALSCTASDTNGTITSYRWDVNGDGNVDYVTGPSNTTINFVYSSAGTYNSSVTVVDDDLLTATAYALVTATTANATNSTPPAIYSWVASPQTGIAPLNATFTLTAYDADGISSFKYDFKNDGSAVEYTYFSNNPTDINGASTNGTRSYVYSSVGNYVANCTVWDSLNASSSIVRRITVTAGSAPVVSGFSATPTTGELPLAVTFTVTASDADSDLESYEFDFNGDNTYDRTVNATLASTTTYTYLTTGTYAAKVRARDRLGNTAVSSPVSITVRSAKVAGASNQSAAVSSVTVNTQDTFPMSSSALINNYRIAENNFTSLADVREFTSAVAPATGVPATYCYKFSGVSQNVAELRLFKLTGSTNIPFRYASAPSPDSDGAWWVTTAGGTYLSPTSTVTASNVYQACFVIKDNGAYDLDRNLGSIRDPQVLGAVPLGGGSGGVFSGSGGGGGGGGGCTLSPGARPGLELVVLLGLAVLLMSRGRAGRRD